MSDEDLAAAAPGIDDLVGLIAGGLRLFWVLPLDLANVEFVMPYAGVQVALAPGDLIVFDPTMAHGLCRPADNTAAVEASFLGGKDGRQAFLTGEIPLTDAQWAALGAPWLPIEEHERRGALDLLR